MTKPLKITLISIGGIVALLLLAILYLSFDGRSRLNVLRHRLFSKSGEMIKEYVLPARWGRILAADGRTLAVFLFQIIGLVGANIETWFWWLVITYILIGHRESVGYVLH